MELNSITSQQTPLIEYSGIKNNEKEPLKPESAEKAVEKHIEKVTNKDVEFQNEMGKLDIEKKVMEYRYTQNKEKTYDYYNTVGTLMNLSV
jgi:hypothetical protein